METTAVGLDSPFIINAVAVSLGPTLAVTIGAIINWKAAQRATKAAAEAQKATVRAALDAIRAQESASIAARDAANAARALVQAAKASNAKLDEIASVGNATHKIVNNQRTVMLNVVAELRTRIAKENPHDAAAQLAAQRATEDANATAN